MSALPPKADIPRRNLNVRLGPCVTSNAGPNGMCNCTRDEGWPFEVGNQVLVSSHRKLLWSKAMVVSVAENRNEIPAGKIERGERKPTVGEVSKAD